MSEEIMHMENEERGKRPVFLKVLCILTFISTGGSLLTTLVRLVSGPYTADEMLEQKVQMTSTISEFKKLGSDYWVEYMEKVVRFSEQANDNFYIAMVISLLVAGLGLFAALQMWKGIKNGFHLYIVYNLIGILSIYTYASPSNIHSLNIVLAAIMAGIFIFMYSRNVKWMR